MKKPKKKAPAKRIKKYSVAYFIKKFSAIPTTQWCQSTVDDGNGRRCALGHCGVKSNYLPTPESNALVTLFGGANPSSTEIVTNVNDAAGHPKFNILKRLRSIVRVQP